MPGMDRLQGITKNSGGAVGILTVRIERRDGGRIEPHRSQAFRRRSRDMHVANSSSRSRTDRAIFWLGQGRRTSRGS